MQALALKFFLENTKCFSDYEFDSLIHGNGMLQGTSYFQPRPQGFSLKKWVGREGKALGTRLLFDVSADK